ncbi:hypothetical protein DFH09DRAFT_1285568 [Mycena vulgaris]|nr:hypothetical protein DFH09DRAFT_1285568 [Mycena vulgaris]
MRSRGLDVRPRFSKAERSMLHRSGVQRGVGWYFPYMFELMNPWLRGEIGRGETIQQSVPAANTNDPTHFAATPQTSPGSVPVPATHGRSTHRAPCIGPRMLRGATVPLRAAYLRGVAPRGRRPPRWPSPELPLRTVHILNAMSIGNISLRSLRSNSPGAHQIGEEREVEEYKFRLGDGTKEAVQGLNFAIRYCVMLRRYASGGAMGGTCGTGYEGPG